METFISACLRSKEAACFRVGKCANNRQLIVAIIQRIVLFAYAARFRLTQTRKMLCALRICKQTVIGIFFYTETVKHMRVLHDDEICFTSMDAIFKRS